jgi:hypothetical protein
MGKKMSGQLSRDDYIYVGVGWLYAPPFLSRHLLYQFFDRNCAVLLYHSRDQRASPVCTIGNVSVVEASREPSPTNVCVHCCSTSASAALTDLLELPPARIALPEDTPTETAVGDLTVQIELCRLPLTEKLIMACGPLPSADLGIAGSSYHVAGPVQVSYWPKELAVRDAKQRCWKVTVCNKRDGKSYDLKSSCNWSLTALDMEEGTTPACAVSLKRVSNEQGPV